MFDFSGNDKDSLFSSIMMVGAGTVGLPALGWAKKKYDENLADVFGNYGNKLPGSDYFNNQVNRTVGGSVLSSTNTKLQQSVLSSLMALEEMIP